MILESFALITAHEPGNWSLEDEENAILINNVLDNASCHCNRLLCSSWRKSIIAQDDKYKWQYALHSIGVAPTALIR